MNSKQFSLLLAVCAVMSLVIIECSDRSDMEGCLSMNEEIQNLISTYQRSLNEADVDLVRAVYAEDAIFIGQPVPTALL